MKKEYYMKKIDKIKQKAVSSNKSVIDSLFDEKVKANDYVHWLESSIYEEYQKSREE